MVSDRETHRVYKALHRPLTVWGVDRRLFFLALMMGAAMFNLFYSFSACSFRVFVRVAGVRPNVTGISANSLSSARFARLRRQASPCCRGRNADAPCDSAGDTGRSGQFLLAWCSFVDDGTS